MSDAEKLKLLHLRLTQPATEKVITIRCDLIGVIEENTRGTTDVYTTLTQDGDSKVFTVSESRDEIQDAMRQGLWSLRDKDEGKKK